jgi:hypothetical protein
MNHLFTCALVLLLLIGLPTKARAEERWAVVLSGASGGAKYAEQMQEWRKALGSALLERYGFTADKVRVLVDETDKTGAQGNAENVRKLFGDLRKQLNREDLLLLVLIGHGTYDGDTAKFNLVGPDLTAADWAGLVKGLPGKLVVINTTEASFPFLERLSAEGRVVITATDSAAQKYATVFPQYLAKSMGEASTDLDKNGRTSVFELFAATSAAVKQHYEQRGQLTTERSIIDDNGDGVGREAEAPGPDGGLARTLYLDAEVAVAGNDPELAELIKRRRELETAAEALKLKKDAMPGPAWLAEYEKLMVELAKVSQQIRNKT